MLSDWLVLLCRERPLKFLLGIGFVFFVFLVSILEGNNALSSVFDIFSVIVFSLIVVIFFDIMNAIVYREGRVISWSVVLSVLLLFVVSFYFLLGFIVNYSLIFFSILVSVFLFLCKLINNQQD